MRRLSSAVLSATIGAFLGYQFALYRLAPELHSSALVGMYASAGAVLAVLGLRFGTLLWKVWKEFF
ncbi:MAG: hypothetical protein IT384_01275 [Deltaproteobacteria bacterium]|nr:hypothetical protein [Deltaproteobacteria bacterium]